MEFIEGELVFYTQRLGSDFTSIEIAPISDAHFGDPLFSLHHFEKTLKFLDAPNHFGILNGDLLNFAIEGSKSNIYREIKKPQDQRDWMIDRLKPYAKKLLGMTTGNHEDRIKALDTSADIAKALNIPYRATGVLLKIMFGKGNNRHPEKPYVYWCYFSHGYGGARTKSAKAIKVERVASWIHADFYVISHDHVVNVAPDIYLMPDNRTHVDKNGFEIGKITAHRKMLIKSNAYIKWGGYSEMGGFPPVDLETPIIKLAGQGKPRVNVEI